MINILARIKMAICTLNPCLSTIYVKSSSMDSPGVIKSCYDNKPPLLETLELLYKIDWDNKNSDKYGQQPFLREVLRKEILGIIDSKFRAKFHISDSLFDVSVLYFNNMVLIKIGYILYPE